MSSAFQPMCGMGSPAGMRPAMPTTSPRSSPSPACSPYSWLRSKSSCIPRQMPSSGLPLSAASSTAESMPVSASLRRASANAPTPGSITRSAAAMRRASPVTSASSPMAASDERREKRLPTP